MLAAIVRFSLRRRGVVIAFAMLLLSFGAYLLNTASLDIFPEFSAKRVIVQTESPGLSPEQVESLVTLPVEKSMSGLLGLKFLRSESLQGLSVVTAVFEERSEIHRNRQLVSERLMTLHGQLPHGIGPPIAVPLSSSSATVLTAGISSPSHSLMELRTLADWTIVPRLLAVAGVADVNVFGGEIKQLQIQLHPERLRRYGLSLDDVRRATEQATGLRGAGFLENENQRISLQIAGLPATADTLKQVVLTRKDGVNVTLGDLATVTTAPKPPIGAAAIMGKPAVVMMIIGQHGANTLSVSRGVESVLQEFERIFAGQDIILHPHLFRPADYIEWSVRSLAGHLAIGGFLVILVLYAFLFDLRTAFISALAIPLSLLGAIVVLLELGVNLNIMILGGLAIALGEVVDDAIIDTENIFRRLRQNRLQAKPQPVVGVVFAASMEVRSSVVYASFIVALGFVPLLTLQGVAGRLFSPLGYAYILAILVSLLVALSITPALCYLMLTNRVSETGPPPLIRHLLPLYDRLLRRAAIAPGRILAASASACVAGLVIAPSLGGDFLPELREGHYIVHTSTLAGTSLQESMRIGNHLTQQFLAIPGVESVSQWAGRAERGADTYGSHYSEYEIRLRPASGQAQQDILKRLREILQSFPGLLFEANTFLTERVDETISGYTSPVVVNLHGSDLAQLDVKAQEVAERLRRIRGAADIQVRSPPSAPQLQIRLILERLASLGLRPIEVAEAVQMAYEGRMVGKYMENNRFHDVSMILSPRDRHQIEAVAQLPLRTPEGVMITLDQVADIQQIGGRYNILHLGGQRVQTVTCNVTGRDLDSFIAELKVSVLGEIGFPPEIYPEFTGASIEQAQARRELIVHALLAGAAILVLIYIAVGSLRHTCLTLVNLPFSLVGGVIAATVTNDHLSVGSMVGFVTLFGITVRNAIMLISHYRHLITAEGKIWDLETAIVGAQERLPSILMTALVTALAMMPIAVNSDNPGREIMGPMAVIIIGGLGSSTLLNLLLLPIILWRYGDFQRSVWPETPTAPKYRPNASSDIGRLK